MISRFHTTLLACLLSIFAALAFSGCSPKARLDRHIASGQRYLAEGNYAAAEIEFRNAQRIDPRSGAAMAGLGSIYFDQGSLTKAAPMLAGARELVPDALDARVRLARALVTLGRPSEARAEAAYILGRRASDPEALQILAETSVSPDLVSDTRARVTADDAPSHVALALLDLRENNLASAVVHADRALALDAKSAPAHSLMAGIHLLRNEPDAAASSLRKAVDLSPVRSPRRLALARFEAGRGDLAAARAVLENTLKQAPDFLPAAIMLAELMANAGESAPAQKLLDDVRQRDPEHPEAGLLRARIHLLRGENTTAISQLEALVARYPEAAPMHQLLASAYLATNDTQKAVASLTRTLQLAPDNVDAIVARAALQVSSGDLASAIPALREVLKKQPGNARARVLLADALRTRGQSDEALQLYREAIQATPEDATLRYFAGLLHAQLGQPAEARASLEAALRLRPDFTACVEQLVALDLAAKDLASAGRRAEAHAAVYTTSAEAQMLAAKVAVAQGDSARAETLLRRAIEVNPESAPAYLLLAQLYLSDKRQDEALVSLQTASAKNPRDVSSLMLMGILQQQRGDLKAARDAYERLLQASPRFVPALNNLAYLLSEDFGELDRAYELANRARELRPNDPVALDTFGWILFQRRDYAWAGSVLAESASRLTTNPEIQYHLGMARYMLGDEPGARSALSAAVGAAGGFRGRDRALASLAILDIAADSATERDVALLHERITAVPDDPVARTRLAAILARRGQHAEALAAYETVLKAHPTSAAAMINLAGYLITRPDGLARAFDLAKVAYKTTPEDPVVLHTLGRAAFASGDHAWAASLLREAVRRTPERAGVRFDFALAAYAMGQIDDALDALRQITIGDESGERLDRARQILALTEGARGTPVPPAVKKLAADLLAKDPADLPALLVTGIAQEEMGSATEALATYDKVLAAYPRFSPALKRRALVLARANPPTPAGLEAANKAREALPNDPDIAAALGTIHFHRGEYPRAATLLGEAARSPNAAAETLGYLGLAQRRLGDKERARASLQRALDLGLRGPLADEVRSALTSP